MPIVHMKERKKKLTNKQKIHVVDMKDVLMKLLSHNGAKNKTKRLKCFKFGTFVGRIK